MIDDKFTNDSKIRYNSSTDWVQVYHESTWKNWKLGGMNVDPTKMELTQDEFIAICGQGLQSYMSIGAIIHVNNEYCNTLEVIDVNHDGTLNTVDVMAHTQVNKMTFGSTNDYYASGVRTWINSTYINAFDYDVRELMKTMQVVTKGVTENDKAKLLSWKELGITYTSGFDNSDGGTQYPVFTAGAYNAQILDRWRGPGNYGNASKYWLRSRYTGNYNNIWKSCFCEQADSDIYYAGNGGDSRFVRISEYENGYDISYITDTNGVLPVLRF